MSYQSLYRTELTFDQEGDLPLSPVLTRRYICDFERPGAAAAKELLRVSRTLTGAEIDFLYSQSVTVSNPDKLAQLVQLHIDELIQYQAKAEQTLIRRCRSQVLQTKKGATPDYQYPDHARRVCAFPAAARR